MLNGNYPSPAETMPLAASGDDGAHEGDRNTALLDRCHLGESNRKTHPLSRETCSSELEDNQSLGLLRCMSITSSGFTGSRKRPWVDGILNHGLENESKRPRPEEQPDMVVCSKRQLWACPYQIWDPMGEHQCCETLGFEVVSEVK